MVKLTYDRTKKEINIKEDAYKHGLHILDDFRNYTDGVRVLFLIHRNKEGGETNNTKVKKVITKNSEEFKMEFLKLVDFKERNKDIPYRIYSSVNSRDMAKAIRKFKYEQLEADYYDEEQKNNFYYDIKNRFLGCIMQPTQKASSLFLFDVDDVDGKSQQGAMLDALGSEAQILDMFKAKNGWHIITEPFNYTKIKMPEGCELKKDGLLLLDY